MRMIVDKKKSIALIIILVTIVTKIIINAIKMRQLKKEIIYILMELDILKRRN